MARGRGRGRGRGRQQQSVDEQSGQQQAAESHRHQPRVASDVHSQPQFDNRASGQSVRPKTTRKLSGQFEDYGGAPEQSYRRGAGHEQYTDSSSELKQTFGQKHGVYQHVTIGRSFSEEQTEQRPVGFTRIGKSGEKRPAASPPSTEMGQLSVTKDDSKFKKAVKPGYGTAKRKEIEIVTNFFRINTKNQNIYHYDVDISRVGSTAGGRRTDDLKPINSELGRQIIFEMFNRHRRLDRFAAVYDGKKNMFTAAALPLDAGPEFGVSLSLGGRPKNFCVAIKPVKKKTGTNIINPNLLENYRNGTVTTYPEEIRLVYETVLCHRTQECKEMRFGASFFSLYQRQVPTLGDGVELRQGYNQNLRFTEIGTAVVINVATATFHKSGPILDYMSDILRTRITYGTHLERRDLTKLTSAWKGLRIQVTHDSYKRKYYIEELTSLLPRSHRFPANIDGHEQEVSVDEYLLHVYRYQIKYIELPLLRMRGGKVLLPPEVCDVVPGQRIPSRKLDRRKTAQMIRSTAIPPVEKFRQIQQYAEEAANASPATLDAFGLSFDKSLEPVSFKTRVLKQPEIEYSPSDVVSPDDKGMWEQRRNFLDPAKTNSWMIISFANPQFCDEKILDKLANLLCQAGKKVGLYLKFPDIRICRNNVKTEAILEQAKKDGMRFVVVVLSERDFSHSYHEVKFCADVKLNFVSQCVNENVITGPRFDLRVALNLCLKINTKLQGVNHTLSEWPLALEAEAVLIIGADVIHKVDLACSSIAAVVGCVDYSISKYAVSCRALSNPKQNGKNQEIILTLDEMVETILLQYYRTTRRKPEKILFYRDGISEGQFQIALEKEIPLIKKAFRNIQKDNTYQPPITYIVVQKRIQTRFKPKNPNDGIGKMKNVPVGTIVDRHIVDPVNYDFYLVSHEGIQGTSKPIYYTVLFDENRVKPDVIQKLTFYLCFVFARCNRSISIPAPVRYADLLAYRAQHYVNALRDQPRFGHNSRSCDEIPPEIKELVRSVEKIQNRMFFI